MGFQSSFAKPSRFVNATKLVQNSQTDMNAHENSRLAPWHTKHAELTPLNTNMFKLGSFECLRRIPDHTGGWILDATRDLQIMADFEYFKREAHENVAIVNELLIFLGQAGEAKNVLVISERGGGTPTRSRKGSARRA